MSTNEHGDVIEVTDPRRVYGGDGRDPHDVRGRNLAVIALKSEFAVQLTRRGRPEAVEQMVEVRRSARGYRREVREAVRGYRDAAPGGELAGAEGVLSAAGIDCEVSALGGRPAARVQSGARLGRAGGDHQRARR